MNDKRYSDDTLVDPAQELRKAIEKLDVFTQPNLDQPLAHIHNLEIQGNDLVVTPLSSLQKVVNLTRCFIGAMFSSQIYDEQSKKRQQIQQEILQAVDIIKSHYPLIEKLKQGDDSQKHFADYALEVIQRYNKIMNQPISSNSWISRFAQYIYQRSQLALEESIKGHLIEPPQNLTLGEEVVQSAYKTFKELSITLSTAETKKINPGLASKQKKTMQVMVDAFRLKGARLIQNQFSHAQLLRELLTLIKESPIEVEESADTIYMQQILSVLPDMTFTLKGEFKKHVEVKLMSIPVLENLSLTSQLAPTGVPFPSEYGSWALPSLFVNPYPLRLDQTPLFHELDQQRKELRKWLSEDFSIVCQQRQLLKWKKELFNQERSFFLSLHRQLIEAFFEQTELGGAFCQPQAAVLDSCLAYLQQSESPFDFLCSAYEYFIYHFVNAPAQKLQEAWLEGQPHHLRTGQPADRLKVAIDILETERNRATQKLDASHPIEGYILLLNTLLGKASQALILQYLSEKIGFAPPMLDEFEQKLQACAFQQQLDFIEEVKAPCATAEETKRLMEDRYQAAISLLKNTQFEDLETPATELVNELEVYFNSRFYAASAKKI